MFFGKREWPFFWLGNRESSNFCVRDSGICNSFREAGFTLWLIIPGPDWLEFRCLASFYVPRFGIIFGAESLKVPHGSSTSSLERTRILRRQDSTHGCKMEEATVRNIRFDVINCVAIFYERGKSGSNFLHKEKFRAELPRDENNTLSWKVCARS